ncbi:hypothetical protein EJB05_47026, partial [Eragrostis curvula]
MVSSILLARRGQAKGHLNEQEMNVLLSAVASDLIGRLMSFLVGKYKEASATDDHDTAVRLQRALLRARVVVEEAEGRQIANRAMLLQLCQLRRALCRAAYALDAFRWRAVHPKSNRRRSLATVSRSRSRLEAMLRDMKELVVLLGGCPRVTRQPYSTYLFMERCMFGRQMEKEEIIGFCLKQPCHQDLDVLPIIGPHGVGKWTLVEHVCLDERVRERFAKIHRLSSDQLDHLESLLVDDTARSLMVIDMVDGGDANGEEPWRRFHTAVRRRAHGGSKIIVISRTEAHSRSLGTVPPLRLIPPRREELWYFFRALAFGAADPDDRPDLARVAIALCDFAMGLCDFALYAAANTIAASLRADLSAHAWRRVHKVYAEATSLQLGAARERFEAGHYYLCRSVKGAPGAPCLFSNRRKLIYRRGTERAAPGDDAGPARRRLCPSRRGCALRPAGVAVSHPSVWELRRHVRYGESRAAGGP